MVEQDDPESGVIEEQGQSGIQAPATRLGQRVRNGLAGLSQRPHTPAQSARYSVLMVGAVALAYWFTEWPLLRLTSGDPNLNFYLAQPLIWLGIAALAGYGWLRLAERPPFSRLLVGVAFLVGVFHVAVLLIAGVIWNLGDSPLSGRLVNYPKNLWYFSTLLAGAEAARAYLFQVWRRWNRAVAFAVVALIFFALAIPAAQWTAFYGVRRSVEMVAGSWLPALGLSLICTWLVHYGGIGPSFGYRFALLAFQWFSPLLPDLQWPVWMAIGLGVPLIGSWLVEGIYEETAEGRMRKWAEEKQAVEEGRVAAEEEKKRGWWFWTSWALTLAVVALGVLFATGFLGFKLAVIDGISMEPTYSRGDVAIVREGVDPATLEVGDVVLHRRGDLTVVHRIVAIEEGADGPVFTTQGDNRSSPDPPFGAEQLEGKVVFTIPWVGYLNLWLRGR